MSFSENFERDNQNEVIFDTNAFYPVLATMIVFTSITAIALIIRDIFFSKIKYEKKEYRNCQCEVCKKKFASLVKKKNSQKKTKAYFVLFLITIPCFILCYNKILVTSKNIKVFDPYEILGISQDAEKKDIKKAYKKLALKYHPDKNPNNLQAKAHFQLVVKAYNSLTDEESKKNFEKYGNPDGNKSMRYSLGLPAIILDKRFHMKILLVFLFLIVIVIPHFFFKWYERTRKYNDFGVLNETCFIFSKMTNSQITLPNLPFYIGLAAEFREEKLKPEEKEFSIIESTFSSYEKNFPSVRGDSSLLTINNKKAIMLGYAYSLGELTEDMKNSLKQVDEYLIIFGNLIDAFYISQYEKNELLQKISRTTNIKTQIEPVPPMFLNLILLYQQMFFQGIPAMMMSVPEIAYLQLPNFTVETIKTINSMPNKLSFLGFLKLEESRKLLFLKDTLKFTEAQALDCIEAAKSLPQYELKLKAFVDGFVDFVVGDMVTFQLKIKRLNVGKEKKIGFGHSLRFPGVINECLHVCVRNGNNIFEQTKLKITKKETVYDFRIRIGTEGKIAFSFETFSNGFFGMDKTAETVIEVVKKSAKREEMVKKIESKKVKIELSFFQQVLKENGLLFENEEDDEEEEEEEESTPTQTPPPDSAPGPGKETPEEKGKQGHQKEE